MKVLEQDSRVQKQTHQHEFTQVLANKTCLCPAKQHMPNLLYCFGYPAPTPCLWWLLSVLWLLKGFSPLGPDRAQKISLRSFSFLFSSMSSIHPHSTDISQTGFYSILPPPLRSLTLHCASILPLHPRYPYISHMLCCFNLLPLLPSAALAFCWVVSHLSSSAGSQAMTFSQHPSCKAFCPPPLPHSYHGLFLAVALTSQTGF